MKKDRGALKTSLVIPPEQAQHEYIYKVQDVYYFPFDKTGLEKPWNENKEKNDEYFNYGMYDRVAISV